MVWDRPLKEKCPSCGADFLVEKWQKNKMIKYCLKCDFKQEVKEDE